MQNLIYNKYYPSTDLKDVIDAYWIIENKSNIQIDIPVVPDGCMDIIYQNDQLILVGAMSEGIVVPIAPDDYSFGIRFKPAIFIHLLNDNFDTTI
jgi:hypothetical protein